MVGRHEYSDTYDGKQKRFYQAPTTRWDRYYTELLVYQKFLFNCLQEKTTGVGIQHPKTRNNGQKYQTSDSPLLTLERKLVKIVTLILHSAIFVLQDGVLICLEMTYCHTAVIRYFLHVSPSIVGRAYVAKIYFLTNISKVFV